MAVMFGAITGIAVFRPLRSSIRSCHRRQANDGTHRRALGIGSRALVRFPPPTPHRDGRARQARTAASFDDAQDPGTTDMKLGLVIASHGRPDILQQVLMHLVSQPRIPDDIVISAVDPADIPNISPSIAHVRSIW